MFIDAILKLSKTGRQNSAPPQPAPQGTFLKLFDIKELTRGRISIDWQKV